MTEFDQFWAAYPRKVGKLAAQREYDKARKTATAAAILSGVEGYRRNKPDYADWCHPSTWLHQGRWMDEADRVPSTRTLSEKTAKTLRGALEFVKGDPDGEV